jgi:hypothetical protein
MKSISVTHLDQILSITCDNASNNDEMVRHLGGLINEFKGRESQTRCFAHILNLIAKSIIRQLDTPKAQANRGFDEATAALLELAGNIDIEEQETAESGDDRDNDEEEENIENWVDERDAMTEEELAVLDKSVQPVRLMLVKVRVFFETQFCALRPLTHAPATCFPSCAKPLSPSKTRRPFSFLAGMKFSKSLSLMLA